MKPVVLVRLIVAIGALIVGCVAASADDERSVIIYRSFNLHDAYLIQTNEWNISYKDGVDRSSTSFLLVIKSAGKDWEAEGGWSDIRESGSDSFSIKYGERCELEFERLGDRWMMKIKSDWADIGPGMCDRVAEKMIGPFEPRW